MEINILIEHQPAEEISYDWLKAVAELALAAQGTGPDVEMGLLISGEERVKELNRAYRGKDEPTDVLSFYMQPPAEEESAYSFIQPPDGISHLGEVVICYPQAVKQSKEHNNSLQKELAILIIHGILHLLGYDHEKTEGEREMKVEEAKTLALMEGLV